MVAGFGSRFFYPHTVRVRHLQRAGGAGSRHGEPRNVAAEVKDEQRLIRDANAQEIVSSARVTVALAANVAVGSLVTVWPGAPGERECRVVAVVRQVDEKPLPSFLVLYLE